MSACPSIFSTTVRSLQLHTWRLYWWGPKEEWTLLRDLWDVFISRASRTHYNILRGGTPVSCYTTKRHAGYCSLLATDPKKCSVDWEVVCLSVFLSFFPDNCFVGTLVARIGAQVCQSVSTKTYQKLAKLYLYAAYVCYVHTRAALPMQAVFIGVLLL